MKYGGKTAPGVTPAWNTIDDVWWFHQLLSDTNSTCAECVTLAQGNWTLDSVEDNISSTVDDPSLYCSDTKTDPPWIQDVRLSNGDFGSDGIRDTKLCTVWAPFLNKDGPNAPICPDLKLGLPASGASARPYSPLPIPLPISKNNPDCSYWVSRFTEEAIATGATQGTSATTKCHCASGCVPIAWQSIPEPCRLGGDHKADIFLNNHDPNWVDGSGESAKHCSNYYLVLFDGNATQASCAAGISCPEGFMPLSNSVLEQMNPAPTPGATPQPATNMCDLYKSLVPAVKEYSAQDGNCEWPDLDLEALTSACNLNEQPTRSGICLP